MQLSVLAVLSAPLTVSQLAAELGLGSPVEAGAAPRIVELGCGLSNLSLDLAR